ncbi:hypothetical protein DICPUDRAFT_47060 [Dictyostelium purpureum]|uniref:SEC7 domain-containing protein n=1 Tax=Dictyostelium purpureum TaxID=5786 RepID=F0ZHI8_DICPU|nr:uncharacterized protein DICPUDRAFT_47060 [Dictyostelium purpureum]EGC36575.1 hypothetical protein DICPUDRAFT_47060 [Dictyostelium purpureum]|eukprot:XP_003286879.1 hypothetical protein DICPUDRAFT_47060 [Dictyostelium purpureum]
MDDSIALMFNNTLQKIFSTSSRKNTHLRDCCKVAQDTIRDSPLFSKSDTKHDIKEYELLANKLYLPMKLACETKEPKIMTIALDCLDKMMSYGMVKPQVVDETSSEKKKLVESMVELIGSYFSFQDENVQLQIIKALLTSVITPTCDVHDTCLMNAIKTSYNIYLVSTNKINSTAAKSALFQMVDSVLQKFEIVSQQKLNPSNSNNIAISNEEINLSYQSNLSDVILLFRAFCKLSTKDIPDGLHADSHEMKSKMLSLELLSRILENPLPSLKLSEKFIQSSIKRYLSNSLLTNGTNQHLPVFKLTLTLFLSLIIHFKEYLKEEIGLFFSKILLNVLSSPSCSAKQKWLILPVLYEICKNPQTIVDIFVNYDCDPERKDIFEKMVYELSRVAQGTITGDQRTSSLDDMKFKTLGLECIVTIMKSLVDWSKELYENSNVTKINKKLTSKEDLSSGSSGESTPRKKLSSSTSSSSSLNDKDLSSMSPLEQGIYKFNQSSKRGVEFLIKQNIIKESPEDIAQFFKSNISNLDPKKVGEYLVQQNSFNFSVLFKYVELFDFKDMNIDESLRNLLFGFLLHGENQCIDKIIEKFAEKYFNDNSKSSIFSNAESVYLLSYSIILLSTDLHNPSITSKMTKSDWIKMNSKSNNKQDFEESFLIGIYDRVLKEPFKIINDDLALDSQERLLRFNRENDYIAKQCQELIKAKLSKKSIFYKARNIEHVRPMFLLSWCYVLSTLSVVLDDTKDKKVIQLCLEGFSYAIRVSCIFYMNVERSSFITSLSKFSLLDSIKEPSLKNIECVKTLLSIGISEGNYLQDSWQPILKSICILERFQLFNSIKNQDNNFINNNDESLVQSPHQLSSPQVHQSPIIINHPDGESPQSNLSHPQTPNMVLSPTMIQYNNIEIAIKKLIEENQLSFDSSQIERIFTNTSNLSDDSIVTFFRCLCEVSEDEINHYSRNYSLIKLVEVIEYNFKRIRLVFYNIWEIVVQHFTKVGCNSNIEIAQHSIDSLRQLANKYLEKQELSHYNFQNEFLKPFQDIMKNNPSNTIKELVIRCVVQLSILKAKNIKSGWKTIINVLQSGSKVQNENIVTLSYQGLEQIINKNFDLVEDNFFIDIIQCLSSFSSPSVHYANISIKALESLNVLSQKVAPDDSPFDNINDINRLLIPILEGTAQSISHENENVRKLSCALLFDLFNIKGKQFDDDIWQKIINQIISPIFSNIDLTNKSNTEMSTQWLKTTFPILLNYLIEFFIKFNKELRQYLDTVLNLLEPFICCSNELSCQIAIDFYALFISKCSNYFTNEFWCTSIIDSINRVINKLLVSKLVHPSNNNNNNINGNDNSNTSITSPSVSAITPETPKKSNNSTAAFSRTLSSLKPFIITEYESSSIGKEMRDNLIKFEKTEPFLSIHNWNTAIKFLQKITEVCSELQSKTPCKFSVLLVKNWDIVFVLSQRINSEMIFINHFGEANSQNYECSALSLLLALLFDMYSSEPINEDNIKKSKEAEDILSRLSLGILKENSLSTLNNNNSNNQNNNNNNSITSPTTSTTSSSSTSSNTTRIFNNNNIRVIKIICQILQGFTNFNEEQFKKHQPSFFMYFIDLSLHDNVEIRQNLADLIKRCEKDLPQVILQSSAPTPLVLHPAPTIGQKNIPSNRYSANYQQQEQQEIAAQIHSDDQVIIDENNLENKSIVEKLIEKDEEVVEEKEINQEIDQLKQELKDDIKDEIVEEIKEIKEEINEIKEEIEEEIKEIEEIEEKLNETNEELNFKKSNDNLDVNNNNNNSNNSTNINQISDDFTSIGGSNETFTDDGFININDANTEENDQMDVDIEIENNNKENEDVL